MKSGKQSIILILLLLLILSLTSLTVFVNITSPTNSTIFLSTTTSVENTGLLDYLIDVFERDTSYTVRYTAVGSGAAIQLAYDGEVDATLTHAPQLELKVIEDGIANKREVLWYNFFVLVGPRHDPAEIGTATTASEVFEKLATAGMDGRAHFYSRGDNSGTHLKEREIWNSTNIEVSPSDSWYFETGTGMASTLVTADNDEIGYTLSDLGTYATFKTSESDLSKSILFQEDQQLYNPYSYMIIDATTVNRNLNTEGATAFLDFLQKPATKDLVRTYTRGNITLFQPVE